MRNIWVSDSFGGHYEAIDGTIELDGVACGKTINDWRKRFFKPKNIRPALIQLRCFYKAPEPFLWTYYLELLINGKIVEQLRMREEAFDVLKYDKPQTEYVSSSVLFIEYQKFTPEPRPPKVEKPRAQKQKEVIKSIWDFDDSEPSILSNL